MLVDASDLVYSRRRLGVIGNGFVLNLVMGMKWLSILDRFLAMLSWLMRVHSVLHPSLGKLGWEPGLSNFKLWK